METRYDIVGMTCEHCARAVAQEVGAIPGADSVAVDVAAGAAIVTSERPLDEGEVRQAVEEAGYALGRPGRLPLL